MRMISVPTRIISTTDGDKQYEGKPINVDFIVDESESSFDRALRFFMAANGIRPGSDESDNEFRARFGDADLSVDPANGTLGAAWATLQGKRVVLNVDIRTQGDKQYQDYKGARPF